MYACGCQFCLHASCDIFACCGDVFGPEIVKISSTLFGGNQSCRENAAWMHERNFSRSKSANGWTVSLYVFQVKLRRGSTPLARESRKVGRTAAAPTSTFAVPCPYLSHSATPINPASTTQVCGVGGSAHFRRIDVLDVTRHAALLRTGNGARCLRGTIRGE